MVVVDAVVVVDDVVVVELVVGLVVVVGGRVVVVVDAEVVVDDDVVVVDDVVAGVVSSSDARSAKMIKTTATAMISTASAQKIGLLKALLSDGGGPAAYVGSAGGGIGSPMFGSVGVGSTEGIAWVGSSAPGRSPLVLSPGGPGSSGG